MELIFIAVLVASLSFNVAIYANSRTLHKNILDLVRYVPEQEPVVSVEQVISEVKEEIQAKQVTNEPVKNESNKAWRNERDIPAVTVRSAPDNSNPLPPKAPLERPYGFYR